MASHNKYRGYVKLPKVKEYPATIRLDFTPHIVVEPGASKLEGFSLRLFAPPEINRSKMNMDHPEIGVTLRPEEWLDLIDAMKEQFEIASKTRKDFDERH